MATISKLEDLVIWQKAREISLIVYQRTDTLFFQQNQGLKIQIRNSAGSIADNIAEGFGRSSQKEFIHALFVASGELQELTSQIIRCGDFGIFNQADVALLTSRLSILDRMIRKLSFYLNHSGIKGQQFKGRMG
ncbi:four helix bundle protein [Flavihumibacter petaseus]|uniref:Four helix bundle protein n=1 Tax=Flavihumibacter petaseus NBRC 106054 TaxID=1220578 RepID=A0A0E9N488_9BACT|nr:four helix bundle protein [Flavihumibacter petaseus]GAO44180.1 hypothetical protein FPE01S_03_02180 [Flavihumibacter petaseus NBRC 106054]